MENKEKSEKEIAKKIEEEIKEENKERKKVEASVLGKDLAISTKHAVAICRAIKGKTIDEAIELLSQVIKKKKAIPMKGEIPHRKGMERGRYPQKAAQAFIKLLKSLDANSSQKDIKEPVIKLAMANLASRPFRRGGRRKAKRTHVLIKSEGVGEKWKKRK